MAVIKPVTKWAGQQIVGDNWRTGVPALGWFLGSIGLLFLDSFVFHFAGFKLLPFIRNVRIEQAMSLLSFIAVSVFLFALFRIRIFQEKREIIRKIFFWFIITFIFIFGASGGTALHIIFGILFWLSVLKRLYKDDSEKADMTLLVLIIFDFFLAPLLASAWTLSIPGTDLEFMKIFENLKVLFAFPIYFLFMLFNGDIKLPPVARWFGTLIVIFIIISMLPTNFSRVYGAEVQNINRFEILSETWDDVTLKFSLITNEVSRGINDTVNGRINDAAGGYYEGQVDQKSNEKLGVYLENVKAIDQTFYETDKVTIWGDIKAKALANDKEIEIKVDCIADNHKKDEKTQGKVWPKNNFTIYSMDEENINCEFEPGQLSEGTHFITLSADFNFPTYSYLKTYFMSEENIRALTKDNRNVFDFYKVKDTDPKAKFTNGPIMLGIETKSPPIGLTTDFDSTPFLGFTLENRWEGRILEIEKITLELPRGMEIDLGSCNQEIFMPNFEEKEGFNVYESDPNILAIPKYKNIDKFVSFRCRMRIKTEDVNNFLDQPLTTKSIRLLVDYKYRLEKRVTVKVSKMEGFNVFLNPSEPTSKDNVICKAKHTTKDIKSATAKVYVDKQEAYEEKMTCSDECTIKIEKDTFSSGQYIRCSVNAKLEEDEVAYGSAGTLVKSAEPEIEITFEPENPKSNENLECIIKINDEDGNIFNTAIYEINGGYYDAGDINCINNECKISIDSEELQPGEIIECKLSVKDKDKIYTNSETVRVIA